MSESGCEHDQVMLKEMDPAEATTATVENLSPMEAKLLFTRSTLAQLESFSVAS
jgi:hypothetical protein